MYRHLKCLKMEIVKDGAPLNVLLDQYVRSLWEARFISCHDQAIIESGELKKSERNRSLFIVTLVYGIGFLRHFLVVLSLVGSFESKFQRILYILGGDTFKYFPDKLSLALNTAFCSLNLIYVIVIILFLIAEKNQSLFLLQHLRHYCKSAKSTSSVARAIKTIVWLTWIIKHVWIPLFIFTVFIMLILSCLKEQSLLFSIMSTLNFTHETLFCYFSCLDLFHFHSYMFLSSKFLCNQLDKIGRILVVGKISEAKLLTLEDKIIRVYRMIRQQDIMIQNLLGVSTIVSSLSFSLCIFTVSNPMENWLRLLCFALLLPWIVIIECLLYSTGTLHSKAMKILRNLYSIQANLQASHVSYSLILKVKKMIQLVASKRQPLSFTLPDGSPYSTLVTASFMALCASNSLLFLNNRLFRTTQTL